MLEKLKSWLFLDRLLSWFPLSWRKGEKRHYPNKPIRCLYCGGEMVLRWSKIFAHADYVHEVMRRQDAGEKVEEFLEFMDKFPSAYSYADDQEYKCKECGCVQIFGVAINLEQFKEWREKRGYSNMYIDIDEWNNDEHIKKQLKDLGYFGG